MRAAYLLLLAGCLVPVAGCAMCSSCDDYNYAAYGGIWQRTDMQHGRVGSAFSPNGVNVRGDGEMLEPEPLPSGPPNVEELTSNEIANRALMPADYVDDGAGDAAPIPRF